MSRGDRIAVNGNLSTSMRNNYGEDGVAEYYLKVGSTYRNPHYPGIRLCLFSWLNRWWQMEQTSISKITLDQIMLFDLACGYGEATVAFIEWCNTGKMLYREQRTSGTTPASSLPPVPRRKGWINPIILGPEFPKPQIAATDPFTTMAYNERTNYPCAELSFEAIAEGRMPEVSVSIVDGSLRTIVLSDPSETSNEGEQDQQIGTQLIEMVVCSFALHLIENPSSLFALLWQLSMKARWLVILAPHKKPEIKNGWGWNKWNIDTWEECEMSHSVGELLLERVHCRVYRSTNL
ncbi:hypothetical protein GALMADRAFT_56955 [Galerina marginata CBS 339.88]|uniref:Uncharacterized protein n=1 Tax=Galerina marginata (strain CBS 339.88) TaxID=685588 RepID=A0A067TUI7_GALM3|nr:hypothetical protein GALMADRAFT_56955 [Galerina marginata CBS 339.88]